MVTCGFEGCESGVQQGGFCANHRPKRKRRYKKAPKNASCSVEGCDRPYLARELCRKHYSSWWRYGDPTKRFRRDKGEGSINSYGYKVITVDGTQVLEHRHIMEQHLGRPLHPDEQVHHLNGKRADNRLENLELWSTSQPPGQRAVDKVRWAREILSRYEHLVSDGS